MNLDIPGAHDVSRGDGWARPLLSVRGGGKIEIGDNVEIGHMAIVEMPLLHCVQ
jgi:acetyltransferase-like isoleucine patch superfamily enzyme